jgi:23S rRNA pseudouridine1911/1915/1917 synthase
MSNLDPELCIAIGRSERAIVGVSAGTLSKMPDVEETFRFFADSGDAALRLDRILVRRVTAVSRFSRSLAQQWIEGGAVMVNGSPARRPSDRVRAGALVEITFPSNTTLRARPQPEPGPLTILYEDDDVLLIDKPPGTVVHPSYKQASGTLLNAVLARLQTRPGLQPGIVTRLDKHTSGIVLIALTPAVHAALQRAGEAGHVRKQYLAAVRGRPVPPSGRILHPLGRDPEDRRRMIATAGGAPSETRYELQSVHASASGDESLVRCELVTGRTHQIRVHLATAGWPVIGDRTYGTPDDRIGRQALHAWRIAFAHPRDGRTIELESPMPADMAALW